MADFWHKADEGKVHERVFNHVKEIQQNQEDLDRKNRDLARFYSNRSEPGIHGNRGSYRSGWGGITENLIASVVDTATALIAKSRPKVSVLTDNGEWSQQQNAKKAEKYIAGQFDALGVYDKMSMVFRDAAIFGTGCVHSFVHDGKLKIERVLPTEIVVDEETVPTATKPIELHRVRFVSKAVLQKKFPKFKDEIENSNRGVYDLRAVNRMQSDMVLLLESWRLPKGGKGRYSMVVQNATLRDDDYSKDYFPFVFYRWSPPLTGFYGQSLAEYLLGFQVRLNELNDFIHKCQDLVAVPRIWLNAGSRVTKTQLDNEIGRIISGVGEPPTFFTPQAVGPEIYQYKEQIKVAAFEFAGISQMAAQATRPEGIEAGVALRELSDNQSQRFSIQQARYERAHIDLAKLMINQIKGMKKPPNAHFAERFVDTIDFPKIDFEKDNIVFGLQPSSILGDTPAGRLQRIVELAQYGVPIKPEVMQRLLAHPDLELEDNRSIAAIEHAEWVVEQLANEEPVFPDAFMDLPLTIERVTAAYLDYYRLGAPETVLEGMREFITQANQALEAATQPPAPLPGKPPLEGNVAEGALPGVVDITQADAAQTALSGVTNPPTTL